MLESRSTCFDPRHLTWRWACDRESMFDVQNCGKPCHSIHKPIVPGVVQPGAASRDITLNQVQPLPFTPLRSHSLPCLDGPQATSGPVTHPAADEAKLVDNPLASATPQCSSLSMPYRIFSFQNWQKHSPSQRKGEQFLGVYPWQVEIHHVPLNQF